MAELLNLETVVEGSTVSDAVVYIASYKKSPRKNGMDYIAGTFTCREKSLSFKVWENNIVDAFIHNNYEGQVARISGKVSSYNNVIELSITSFQPIDDPKYPVTLFMKTADVNSLFNEFKAFVGSELSPNAQQLLAVIFQNEKLYDRFKEEFAGSHMHDAQIGGLLNHTMKMLRIAKVIFENEPRMTNLQNYKDLLYTSVLLHDIGKVFEMNLGVYQQYSYVSHRTLGVEMLVKYKPVFEKLFDDDFYYQVIAVLQGHHGEFGDPPTTVLAYIVHLIDMLDSQTTAIFDKIEGNQVELRAGANAVRLDSRMLTVQ